MPPSRNLPAALALALLLPGSARAEADPLAVLAERDAICAAGAELPACGLARGRAVALVANAIAEAGQSQDRGAFIDLLRPYLGAEAPELRAAAAYALAKLAPDASDTPALIGLLRDPTSAVRDGAWAAAAASTDPLARRATARFPERAERNGFRIDPAPFDPAALGLSLPEGLDYLWLAAPRREMGELQFLSARSPDDLVRALAGSSGQSPLTPREALTRMPGAPGRLLDFQDEALFGGARVVVLPVAGTSAPVAYAVVYDDRLFAATGMALIFADGRDLVPEPAGDPEPSASTLAPLDSVEAFDAAILAQAGVKPEAPAEETALYLAILASGGAAAEAYLEAYPDGAYADEVAALIAAPRLVLDATRYAETGPILASLVHLPAGSSAELFVLGPQGELASAGLPEAGSAPVSIDIAGRVTPGLYRVKAVVSLPGSAQPLELWREFSVETALAELRTAKTVFAPGEAITVEFHGMSGQEQDYVATVAAGASLNSYLAYVYTGGLRDGQVTLPAPSEPGPYELRAFFNEDESVLRASLPFAVEGPAVPAPEPAEPAVAASPAASDDAARATLTLDRTSYAPGAAITVSFAGMSGAGTDYVATALAGSANESYLQYAYTNAAVDGAATLSAPSEPGQYEVRAFFREDETILRGSVAFTVDGSAPAADAPADASTTPADSARATLALDAASYAPGAAITVTYSGMSGSTSDYVAVAAAGAANGSYLQYAYTDGRLAGSAVLQAPVEPGTYELRAFFREDETILRASVTFTVR